MKDNKNIIQEEIVYTDADSAYDSRMVLRHTDKYKGVFIVTL